MLLLLTWSLTFPCVNKSWRGKASGMTRKHTNSGNVSSIYGEFLGWRGVSGVVLFSLGSLGFIFSLSPLGQRESFCSVVLPCRPWQICEKGVPGRDWEIHPPMHSPPHPLTSWLICPPPCWSKNPKNWSSWSKTPKTIFPTLHRVSSACELIALLIISSFLQV